MPNPGAAGVCAIKQEYIVEKFVKNQEHSTYLGKHKVTGTQDTEDNLEGKKLKTESTDPSKKVKEKRRGQNKARPKTFLGNKESKPCPSILDITSNDQKVTCQFVNCKYIHDPLEYLKTKEEDIGNECHLFNFRGRCPRGLACRFGSRHISEDGYNKVNEEKFNQWKEDTHNTIKPALQTQLQKRTYDFGLAEKLVKTTDTRNKANKAKPMVDECNDGNEEITATLDEDLIKLTSREKKKIEWQDKLYLSPLTTVGNLPFRRICKSFGADITCGEMALCESLLKGLKQEWALIKRHSSEDIFGVQICGNNAYTITKVAQLIEENAEVDFVDLNMGCPIDLIYKKGAGCGMMHRLPALETSIKSASNLLTVPFTVKMRTGVYQDKKIAHTLAPKVAEWGASLITLHGRSREARYTKLSDWEYIETCAQAASPCPVFGNGDIMSYEDYLQKRQKAPSIQGVMIGRGALIKPWIFTEIKQQKLWDISSNERLDILKRYTNYGLEHWGSDTQGVENTRKFLLEWLSFLYRYVPVGLLETPPQKINERPPTYIGRNDLETLMASGDCANWIKISEMLLGPVPDGFNFLPKHKANAYQ